MLDYDAWIPNLADWNFLAEGKQNFSNPLVQMGTIEGLCPVIQQRCAGKDQQYSEYVPSPFPSPIISPND